MTNPVQQAGATVEPSEYASLAMDEQFTGLWTQRSPLRDADVPYIYRKFYSAARFDSIIDGINREISAKLTDRRRPGSSVYNSSTFGKINSYYAFKWIQDGTEVVKTIVDEVAAVYDATPATVGGAGRTLIFTKSAGGGKTRFVSVGPTLYMGNGTDLKQWIQSTITWKAATAFSSPQYIIDSNSNIQQAVGSVTATITAIEIINWHTPTFPTQLKCTLFFDSLTPMDVPDNVEIALSGLTTVPSLNGVTTGPVTVESSQQLSFLIIPSGGSPPVTAYSNETGSATTGTGITGATQPAWATGTGLVTQDGTLQWANMGPNLRNWGLPAAAGAPSATLAAAPSPYPSWAASTWYSPLFVILVSGTLYRLTTGGVTGGSTPTFDSVPGHTTADGTCVWTSLGPSGWVASTVYATGAVIQANYTYYITYTTTSYDPSTGKTTTTTVTEAITVTSLFQATIGGTSGATTPAWTNGKGTTLIDGGVTWTNVGYAPAYPGATQTLSTATTIIDSNGYIQQAQNTTVTNSTAPTWSTAVGSITDDLGQRWLNAGPISAATTAAWKWAWSGKCSATGEISTASPLSPPLNVPVGYVPVIQALSPDDTMDTIVLWRTTEGGALLIYLDEFANSTPNQPWIYTDTTPDTGLNPLIEAPIDHVNDPPPAGLTALEYYDGRVWGIVDNLIYRSGGPDTLVGNGNCAFDPLDVMTLPEKGVRLKAVTVSNGGLLVACATNFRMIYGDGTNSNPYTEPRVYMEKIGILSYDEMDMRGSTLFGFSNSAKAFSFDPSAGEQEIGFPIGDQFKEVTTGGITAQLYTPGSTFVTYLERESGETAAYYSDGAVGWFRFSPVTPPESGSLWSPRAAIEGGTSAVQAVETAPGNFELLIGPASSGPILMRDESVRQDNGVSYPSWDVKGSIGIANTGEVAEISHVAMQSTAVGVRPAVSMLFDEIAAGVTVNGRTTAWDQLELTGRYEEPPNLEPSISMFSDRYRCELNGRTPKCLSFQMKVDYGTNDQADELLKFAIYGAIHKEKKEQ